MGVIAKYKFNNTLEANLLPEFNSEFTSDLYTVTDEVNGEVTTRTIESNSLPTLMRFGRVWVNGEPATDNRTDSLLEVLDMNTSGLIVCYSMFRYCTNLTSVSCEWNTSNVTNMNSMFSYCTNLASLDMSNFDTSNVTTMREMFINCNKLTSLDVSNFNTSNVTSMGSMFYGCNNLTSLDVSNFDTSNVTNMNGILANTDNLKYLKCNNVTTLNTINTQLPAKSSTSQGTIICKSDTTNLDTTALQSKYWNILDEPTLIAKYVFDKSIHNNCIPEFNTEFEGYFIEDEEVEGSNEVIRTIESCGMLPTDLKFGYYTGGKLTREEAYSLMNVEYINTSNMNNRYTYCMFSHCTNLTTLDVSNFDTSKVTTMYAMFYNCYNLTTLDVSNFDTSKVTTMYYMFYNCSKLTTLDASNWNTSKVTNMQKMFNICTNLTSLDLSNWNTSNVTDMSNMFNSCNKLTTLDVSNFNTSNVTSTTNMFTNTPLLTDISVLYTDKSSLQKLVDAMPTDSNKTLWYKDVNIDGITHGDNITLKKYIEENVEIVLNSPLLEGDTIEVVDGKLCHVHKMGMVVLDGSDDEKWYGVGINSSGINFAQYTGFDAGIGYRKYMCDNFSCERSGQWSDQSYLTKINGQLIMHGSISLSQHAYFSTLYSNINDFKQWLQSNPTTVVYELVKPYYEDITPLQSSIALRTFEECNIQIITALPIKTKITYRTNITSAIVMEQELDTLDSGVSLSNLIEEEVNE